MLDVQAEPVEETSALRDRIARRTRELEQAPERAIILPVLGYEGIVSVHYRPIGFREGYKIEARYEKVKDGAEQAILTICGKLIAACVGLLEDTGDADEYRDTGLKWSTAAVRELFADRAAVQALKENATAREAMVAVFPDEEALTDHYKAYEEQRKAARPGVDGAIEGESAAGSTTTV